MRKLSLVMPLGAAALVLGVLPVRADDKSDITALYTKVAKAMKAKDINTILASGTPDFVSIEHGTKMNAKQSKEMMEAQFKMMKSIDEVNMKPTKIDVKGTTANVMSTFSMKATMAGQDGKAHKIVSSGSSKDIFVKTKKGWLMKSMESIDSKMMMDGKPMPMGGGAPPPPKKK
jgi:ketosteroid isomerase-like protein